MWLLIFTDLDGSLLNHADYSYEGARPALDLIAREGWPLVFVTSKTRFEVEPLRSELGIDDPFIVENGAAAYFPAESYFPAEGFEGEVPEARATGSYRCVVFGRPYTEIRRFVEEFRDRLGIRGFGDMEVAEIAALTDLSPSDAERAKRRQFTEPFTIDDPERLPELKAEATERDLAITTGGRFHHLIGAGQSKGRAVRKVQEVLAAAATGPVCSLGIGDSPSDVEMLLIVDRPIVIPRPDGSVLALDREGVLKASEPGSRGWGEAVYAAAVALGGVSSE